jgi:hypothetical protein
VRTLVNAFNGLNGRYLYEWAAIRKIYVLAMAMAGMVLARLCSISQGLALRSFLRT